jgi:DNA-binding FrmR family transcriptional regulator
MATRPRTRNLAGEVPFSVVRRVISNSAKRSGEHEFQDVIFQVAAANGAAAGEIADVLKYNLEFTIGHHRPDRGCC